MNEKTHAEAQAHRRTIEAELVGANNMLVNEQQGHRRAMAALSL
jgi:hypothetical protein